jgi:hypothetical protein
MRRRDFIKVAAGSAMTWPLAARAQQAPKIHIIAYLNLGVPTFTSVHRGGAARFSAMLV